MCLGWGRRMCPRPCRDVEGLLIVDQMRGGGFSYCCNAIFAFPFPLPPLFLLTRPICFSPPFCMLWTMILYSTMKKLIPCLLFSSSLALVASYVV